MTHNPSSRARMEEKKLLSFVEKAGLLSAAEKAGVSLRKVEELKLLSTAERCVTPSRVTHPFAPPYGVC